MTAAARSAYRDAPGYKTEGASRDAADAVASSAAVLRERVVADLRAHGPSTPSAVTDRLFGATRDLAWANRLRSVRSRLSEAEAVVKLPDTEPSPTGGTQHRYALEDAAPDAGEAYPGEADDLRADLTACRESYKTWKKARDGAMDWMDTYPSSRTTYDTAVQEMAALDARARNIKARLAAIGAAA